MNTNFVKARNLVGGALGVMAAIVLGGTAISAGLIGIAFFIIFIPALISIPVWLLWNSLMPALFGLPVITYLQALGLYLLSCLLFKGFSYNSSSDDKKVEGDEA